MTSPLSAPNLRSPFPSRHAALCSRPDYDTYDYNNVLRRGIIDAFSGIVQGLGDEITAGTPVGAATRERLTHSLSSVYPFVASIGADKTSGESYSEDVARAAIALLGDLCVVMPVRVAWVPYISSGLGREGKGGATWPGCGYELLRHVGERDYD